MKIETKLALAACALTGSYIVGRETNFEDFGHETATLYLPPTLLSEITSNRIPDLYKIRGGKNAFSKQFLCIDIVTNKEYAPKWGFYGKMEGNYDLNIFISKRHDYDPDSKMDNEICIFKH